jgi:hypothetical protein
MTDHTVSLELTSILQSAERRPADERCSPTAEASLHRRHPPGKHGIHRYTPEEFGVVPDRVRKAFHEYIQYFGLTPE